MCRMRIGSAPRCWSRRSAVTPRIVIVYRCQRHAILTVVALTILDNRQGALGIVDRIAVATEGDICAFGQQASHLLCHVTIDGDMESGHRTIDIDGI